MKLFNQLLGLNFNSNIEENLNRLITNFWNRVYKISFTKQAFNDPLSLTPEHKQVILKTGKTYYTIKSF